MAVDKVEKDLFQVLTNRRDVSEGRFGYEATGGDDDYVVDRVGHLGKEVAGQEHSPALGGEAAQKVAHPADPFWVEPVQWLVEDQGPGVAEQSAGQVEALAHPEREASDPAPGDVGQADQAEDLVHAAFVDAPGRGQHPEVLDGAPRWVEAHVVNDGPDSAGGIGKIPIWDAADERRPCCRPGQAQEDP